MKKMFLIGLLGCALLAGAADAAATGDANLVKNADFVLKSTDGKSPDNYQLRGDVEYRYMGDPRRDSAGMGVALVSNKDLDGDGKLAGVATQAVKIDPKQGRWYQFSFRGLPQDDFHVEGDNVWMKVEYFADAGKKSLDGKEKFLNGIIDQARKDLAVNGKFKTGGAAVWQTYALRFWLPFEEIDTVKLSVGFARGTGGRDGAFYVNEWKLVKVDGPAIGDIVPASAKAAVAEAAKKGLGRPEKPDGNLIPLGGRWFYLANAGESRAPAVFDHTNADRLVYHDNIWSTPWAGMMTSILKAGDMDLDGKVVEKDRELKDNVTLAFDATAMIVHSKGVPNHPTAKFPEVGRGGNPNYVQEQRGTFYIPLEPKEYSGHFVTTTDNSNRALPMGPIGVAVNGVVFFNPFDLGNTDATNLMDRCCGHPNQMGQYHYHKYPVCINTPWADEGKDHSPLLGWAFDGYPLYGPYEKAGVMAKDIKGEGALNEFNVHFDKERGWHYHVTPGRFPYLIGGFWGTEDSRDMRRGPRR